MKPTSQAAADSIRNSTSTLRAQVLSAIESRGRHGATDEELQAVLCMNPSTERPRRLELQQMGLVADSGETRKTKSGRKAVVWVLAQYVDSEMRQMELAL